MEPVAFSGRSVGLSGITDVCGKWTSKSGHGTFAWGILWRARVPVVHLLHEPCVRKLSMALSLSPCSISLNSLTVICPLLTWVHTPKNIFSFEKRWYGNLLNIGSVKPKLRLNVNFSWTYEKTYKLILKNALRTEMIQKVLIISFISIKWIWQYNSEAAEMLNERKLDEK